MLLSTNSNILLPEGPGPGATTLALVEEQGKVGLFHCPVYISLQHDAIGALSLQLQGHSLELPFPTATWIRWLTSVDPVNATLSTS